MSSTSGTSGLARARKNRLIDIDGTICEDIPNEERERFPYALALPGAVQKINDWYEAGDVITFFTSREERDRQATDHWLNSHGFKYHGLLMGKPRGGHYYWLDNLDVEAEKYTGDWSKVRGRAECPQSWITGDSGTG